VGGGSLVSTSEVSLYKRINLNLLLESSVWDGLCNNNEEDKDLLHWWYGRSRDNTPTLRARVKFFMTHSVPKDIFFPANVFENIILGYNRTQGFGVKSMISDENERNNINSRIFRFQHFTIMKWMLQKIAVSLCGIIFMVAINSLFVIVFISGWLSFGVLWPDIMKKQLFSVKNEKQNRTHEVTENNQENSKTRKDVDKMMIENSNLMEKINEMTVNMDKINEMAVNMEKILAGIRPLPETSIS